MSISSTSKVSTSTQANKKQQPTSGTSQGNSVEKIDAGNSVFIKDDPSDNQNKKNQDNYKEDDEETVFITEGPIIGGALELQEEADTTDKRPKQTNINAYAQANNLSPEEEIDELV